MEKKIGIIWRDYCGKEESRSIVIDLLLCCWLRFRFITTLSRKTGTEPPIPGNNNGGIRGWVNSISVSTKRGNAICRI